MVTWAASGPAIAGRPASEAKTNNARRPGKMFALAGLPVIASVRYKSTVQPGVFPID